jgi:hypothetical protein
MRCMTLFCVLFMVEQYLLFLSFLSEFTIIYDFSREGSSDTIKSNHYRQSIIHRFSSIHVMSGVSEMMIERSLSSSALSRTLPCPNFLLRLLG